MHKKSLINLLLIFTLLGLATSVYLVYNHYYPHLQGGICDITASVSCTVVNSGPYSTILRIPVAIYGIVWFLIFGFFCWKALTENGVLPKVLGWNILGILFIIYFIYIEYVLGTVCPFCTVVHVLIAISLIISIFLYKQFYKSA